jgi:hypothetical protein
MRQVILAAAALTALTGSIARGQVAKPPCNRRMIVSVDSLRDIALRLHPESAETAKRNAFVVVGLVFDSDCRLVHHAIGQRTGPASADVVLARLVPDAAGSTYVTSGFAELSTTPGADSVRRREARDRAVDLGTPWVVWGVQTAGSRR